MSVPTEHTSPEKTPAPGQDRVRRLREQIAELRKRWPPHSVPPGLMLQLDELEDELEIELRKTRSSG